MNRQQLKNLIVEKVAMSGNRKPIIDTTINELLTDIKLYAEELQLENIIKFVEELHVIYE